MQGAVDHIDPGEVVDRIDLVRAVVRTGLEGVADRIVLVLVLAADRIDLGPVPAADHTGLVRVVDRTALVVQAVDHTAPAPVRVVDRTGFEAVVRSFPGESVQVEEEHQEEHRTVIQTEAVGRTDSGLELDQVDQVGQVENRNIQQLQMRRRTVLAEVADRNSAVEVDRIDLGEAGSRKHLLHQVGLLR